MYYVGWVLLILLGVGLGIWAFLWALRSGQFAEQDRARFLPLRDESVASQVEPAPGRSPATYFLGFVGGLVLLAMAAALWLTVTSGRW